MENENRNIKQADTMWFGMNPIVAMGIAAVLVAVSFYLFSGSFTSRVATTPTTTTTPITPTPAPPATR